MSASIATASGPRNWLVTLISAGHFHSHFCALCLPPLFPVLKDALDVNYTALGVLLSAYSIATGVGQIPVGVVVDKIGGRAVLLAGLGVQGVSFALMGLASGYWELIALVTVAGLGNSVFHPADYAILSARIEERYLGRAVSIHTFTGYLGWGAAPPTMIALVTLADWQTALIIIGIVGIGLFLLLGSQASVFGESRLARVSAIASPTAPVAPLTLLRSRPLTLLFLFFFLSTVAAAGLQGFAGVAVMLLYQADLVTGGSALTGFLFASAVGVLLGGWIADRTGRYRAAIVGGCFAMAVFCAMMAVGAVPLIAVIAIMVGAGIAYGLTSPPRDILVRANTPRELTGLAFGFTSSGLSLANVVGPIMFGRIIDLGEPALLFAVVASIALLAIPTVLTLAGDRPIQRS